LLKIKIGTLFGYVKLGPVLLNLKPNAMKREEAIIQKGANKKLEPIGFNIMNKSIAKVFIFGFFLLFLSSCEKDYMGYDGFDGNAFLALSWSDVEPDYIEPGNNNIPQYFYWDDYYRVHPGLYTLYYDGEYWDGYGWVTYAWEVDYEIWINYGEPGSLFYDGLDGMDNYFVVECNPFGPYVFRDLKTASIKPEYELLESTEDATVLMMKKEFFTIKMTYKKVQKKVRTQQGTN
jgi:hypothetical protein